MSGVEIRVRANARQAQNELKGLGASLGRLEANANKLTKSFQNLALGITAVFTGGKLTQGITRSADAMTNMANKVNLVTKNAGQTNVVMNRLFEVAERTRGSVDSASEVFGRFGLALKGTGTSSQELLQVVETVQQAAAISGSSAETAKNAIIQLGQGLSSGQLRGEELNSVLEGMPRLAEAIADGMGIPFGNLREAAKDGLLVAEDVFAAILNGGEAMQKEFDTLKATSAGLATVLANEFTRAVAKLDSSVLGFSDGIKDGLRLGIVAVKAFGSNIEVFAARASAELLILRLNIKYFAEDAFGYLTDLFTGKVSPDQLIAQVSAGLAKVKSTVLKGGKLAIEFTVKKFNILKDMLPSLNEAQRVIAGFTAFVEGLFKSLYKAVVGDSWWTGIFDPAHGEGGVAIGDTGTWGVHLDNAKQKLSAWKDNLVALFANLYTDATQKWAALTQYFVDNELTIGTISTTSISAEFDTQIENLKKSWNRFIEYLESPAQKITPGGLEEVETTTGKAIGKIRKQFADLTTQQIQVPVAGVGFKTETITVDSDLIRGFKDTFSDVSNTVKDNYDSVIEAIKSTPIVIAISSLAEDIGESFSGTKDAITQYFADNKDVLGLAVSAGLGAAINSNLRAVLLRGAFIGLFIKAVSTLGDNAEFIEAIESQARGIGKLMADSLSGEGDLVTDFAVGFKNIGKAIGQGLLDGIFGEEFENDFIVGLTGAIGSALLLFTISGKVRTGILFLGGKLVTAIGGSMVAAELAAGFGLGIADGLKQTKGSLLIKKAAGSLGIFIGQSIQGSIILGITAGLAIAVGSILDNVADKLGRRVKGFFTGETQEEVGYSRANKIASISPEAQSVALGDKRITAEDLARLGPAALEAMKKGLEGVEPSWLEGWFGSAEKSEKAISKVDAAMSLLETGAVKAYDAIAKEAKKLALIPEGNLRVSSTATKAFATGGAVNGPGTGTSDDIPAMLSNGEFVMKASAVQKFGPAFMEAVNAGKVPQFRSGGGVAGTFSRLNEQLGLARSKNDTQGALALIASIKALELATEAQTLALAEGNEEERAAATKEVEDKASSATAATAASRRINPKELAQSYADGFKSDFASALSNALKTGDVKGFLTSIADSFTSRYIDAFVDGLTDSLFKDNKFFDKIFSGSISFGSDTGKQVADGIANGTKMGVDGGAGGGGLMSLLTKTFTELFKGLGDMLGGLGGLFGGGGGGMGGLFSLFSGPFVAGFSQGGTVRNTPGSQAGKDSVPAMLMPGEVVLSKNQLSNMKANGGGQSTQSFNINVQGDVSRQTRQEIVKMMPQIAGGVNAQNKENNYRR